LLKMTAMQIQTPTHLRFMLDGILKKALQNYCHFFTSHSLLKELSAPPFMLTITCRILHSKLEIRFTPYALMWSLSKLQKQKNDPNKNNCMLYIEMLTAMYASKRQERKQTKMELSSSGPKILFSKEASVFIALPNFSQPLRSPIFRVELEYFSNSVATYKERFYSAIWVNSKNYLLIIN